MFFQGWVYGILINESFVYGTLGIILLKTLKMRLYFSEIDTRGWPYRECSPLIPVDFIIAKIRHETCSVRLKSLHD